MLEASLYQGQDVYLLSLRIEYFTNRAGLTEQYGVVDEPTILATAAGAFKFSVVGHCVFIVCLAYYCSDSMALFQLRSTNLRGVYCI